MQIETEKDLRIKQLLLIIFVMLAILIVMAIYTFVWVNDYNHRYAGLVKVEASVIEHEYSEDIKYDKLEYVINGNHYNITADWKSENNIGDKIVIYYDGDNPLGIVRYTEDNRSIILPIITSVFGVIVVSLIVVYILIYISNKKEKLLLNKIIEDNKNNQEDNNLQIENNDTMQSEENTEIEPENKELNKDYVDIENVDSININNEIIDN